MKGKHFTSYVRASLSYHLLYMKHDDLGDDHLWDVQDTSGNPSNLPRIRRCYRKVCRDRLNISSNYIQWLVNQTLSSFGRLTSLIVLPSSMNHCQCQSSVSVRGVEEELQPSEDDSRDYHSLLPVSLLHDKYYIQWHEPLGQGSFGTVYEAIHRETGMHVALKRISKKYTLDDAFQRELLGLRWVKKHGGHPHICALHECYQDDEYYYLTLDLLSGGEMFDALVERGAYSELDASRIFRDVTSAVYFLHGIGLVHGDIKPENCLLSMKHRDDAFVQLADFGCVYFKNQEHVKQLHDYTTASTSPIHGHGGNTIAYSPPEVLQRNTNVTSTIDYPADVWSLGIILYIMLTGLHPFDLTGQATDEEIQHRVIKRESPPLHHSPITAHLSSSALDVIDQCLKWDPQERISALKLLQHPWVQGQMANPDKMLHSDKKLALFRKYKSKVEAKVFANLFTWSTRSDVDNSIYKNASLIERAFHSLDIENKGFLSSTDIQLLTSPGQGKGMIISEGDESKEKLMSLSQFSNLISETMKNRYFPSGCIIYHEGDVGNHMYFINSVR